MKWDRPKYATICKKTSLLIHSESDDLLKESYSIIGPLMLKHSIFKMKSVTKNNAISARHFDKFVYNYLKNKPFLR